MQRHRKESRETSGRHPWGRDRRFASVSFSYGAEKLYLYFADGATFPTEDFATAMKPWDRRRRSTPSRTSPTRARAVGARSFRHAPTIWPLSHRSPRAKWMPNSPRRSVPHNSPYMGVKPTGRWPSSTTGRPDNQELSGERTSTRGGYWGRGRRTRWSNSAPAPAD